MINIARVRQTAYMPIIVEYDNISSSQIDTETSGTSHQQDDELHAARLVIFVGPAIDAAVFCTD